MITYPIGNALYINLTNQCTNNCTFCVRNCPDGVGFNLWLDREPTAEDVIADVGEATQYDEIVFCGYGEPLARLPEVKAVARYIKSLGKRVRVNTNGQADLIWGRPIASELDGLVDAISISLNAASSERYQELCQSEYGSDAYDALIAFATDCVRCIPEVTLSVVDVIPGHEIEKCARIAEEMGAHFRVRHYYST